jgi:restriction endonuclease
MENGTNKNTEYEKFTQEVYQTFIDNEDIKPLRVEHNIKLEGRSGCKHQIDVYYEFEIADILHRVAIECKNFNTSNVSIGRIRDFYGVLTDLGNVQGTFVCKNGYQSGAIKYANYYGINLKELRPPADNDWEGRIKDIEINLNFIGLDIKNRNTLIDTDWYAKKHGEIDEKQTYKSSGMSNEMQILDKNGNRITDFYELDNKLPQNWIEEFDVIHEYKFEEAYIQVADKGLMKIKSIIYTYDVHIGESNPIKIAGEETAKAILKDISTGSIKFFDNDGNVR